MRTAAFTEPLAIGAGTGPFPPPVTGDWPPKGYHPSTYQWIVGWILLIAGLALADRTATGHLIIYYALVLIAVFLLVTQYQFVAASLAPVGTISAPSSE